MDGYTLCVIIKKYHLLLFSLFNVFDLLHDFDILIYVKFGFIP